MTKYTQKQLREMVKDGIAIDISHGDNFTRQEIERKEGFYRQVGYSSGVYGCNGMLLKGEKTNQLYTICNRTQTIYIF